MVAAVEEEAAARDADVLRDKTRENRKEVEDLQDHALSRHSVAVAQTPAAMGTLFEKLKQCMVAKMDAPEVVDDQTVVRQKAEVEAFI